MPFGGVEAHPELQKKEIAGAADHAKYSVRDYHRYTLDSMKRRLSSDHSLIPSAVTAWADALTNENKPYAMAYDGKRYLYIATNTQGVYVVKFDTTLMTNDGLGVGRVSSWYNDDLDYAADLLYKDGFLYLVVGGDGYLVKIDPVSMTTLATLTLAKQGNCLTCDETYVYVGMASSVQVSEVWKVDPLTLTKVSGWTGAATDRVVTSIVNVGDGRLAVAVNPSVGDDYISTMQTSTMQLENLVPCSMLTGAGGYIVKTLAFDGKNLYIVSSTSPFWVCKVEMYNGFGYGAITELTTKVTGSNSAIRAVCTGQYLVVGTDADGIRGFNTDLTDAPTAWSTHGHCLAHDGVYFYNSSDTNEPFIVYKELMTAEFSKTDPPLPFGAPEDVGGGDDVVYKNTSGKYKYVVIQLEVPAVSGIGRAYIGTESPPDMEVDIATSTPALQGFLKFLVPPDWYYMVDSNDGFLQFIEYSVGRSGGGGGGG